MYVSFSFAKLSHNLFIHFFYIRFISFVIPRVCKDRYTLIMPKTMAHISLIQFVSSITNLFSCLFGPL